MMIRQELKLEMKKCHEQDELGDKALFLSRVSLKYQNLDNNAVMHILHKTDRKLTTQRLCYNC